MTFSLHKLQTIKYYFQCHERESPPVDKMWHILLELFIKPCIKDNCSLGTITSITILVSLDFVQLLLVERLQHHIIDMDHTSRRRKNIGTLWLLPCLSHFPTRPVLIERCNILRKNTNAWSLFSYLVRKTFLTELQNFWLPRISYMTAL